MTEQTANLSSTLDQLFEGTPVEEKTIVSQLARIADALEKHNKNFSAWWRDGIEAQMKAQKQEAQATRSQEEDNNERLAKLLFEALDKNDMPTTIAVVMQARDNEALRKAIKQQYGERMNKFFEGLSGFSL